MNRYYNPVEAAGGDDEANANGGVVGEANAIDGGVIGTHSGGTPIRTKPPRQWGQKNCGDCFDMLEKPSAQKAARKKEKHEANQQNTNHT